MEESEEHSHSLGRSNSLSRSPSPIHTEQNRSNNSLDYSEERQNGSHRSGSDDGDRHSLSSVNRSPLYSYQNQSNDNVSHSAGYDSDEVRSYAPTSPTTLDPIKRKRLRIKVSREDRISALPDSLIHQILSLLPAEDAVKTDVLSKRWMYVWTAVPNLAFRHPYCNRFSAFFKFVDQFLFFYSPGKMEKFELDFDYYRGKREGLDSSIHKWLRLVTKHDASEISLHLCTPDWSNHMLESEDCYTLPQFFFKSSSLTKLSTSLCDYAPIGQINWKWLRVLAISHTELPDDVLKKIVVGSPVLEHLKLHACWGITRIGIDANTTLESMELQQCWTVWKKLVLHEMSDPDDLEENSVLDIFCLDLKILEISGNWHRRKCRLSIMPCLIEAYLTFEVDVALEEYIDLAKTMLEKVKNAKQITLGSWCIQVLSVLEFRGLNSPLYESRCKCLTLNTDFKEWDTYALVSVLQNMHSLEELVIDRTSSRQGEDVFFLNPTDFGLNYWESEGKTTSSCLLKHLKTVEIVGIEPFDDDIQEHLLAFVQYLLGNAVVLEKMVLIRTAEQHWRKDDILYVTQKLLRFPRCSQAAVLFS